MTWRKQLHPYTFFKAHGIIHLKSVHILLSLNFPEIKSKMGKEKKKDNQKSSQESLVPLGERAPTGLQTRQPDDAKAQGKMRSGRRGPAAVQPRWQALARPQAPSCGFGFPSAVEVSRRLRLSALGLGRLLRRSVQASRRQAFKGVKRG